MELRKAATVKTELANDFEIVKNKKLSKPAEIVINEMNKLKNKHTKSIHHGHRARLKAQYLQNGLEGLTDIQKIELLLFFAIPQKDTNPIAHNLINRFGSLKKVVEADYNDLLSVSGIKENSALLLSLLKSFKNYCFKPDNDDCVNLDTTGKALGYVKKLFYGSTIEEFYVVCLTKEGKPINYALINKGTIDEVNIQIRTITQVALDNKVNRIIICHNHPVSSSQMSDEDIDITYSIICSCVLNSIDVLDHIIIGEYDDLSMHECEKMQQLKNRAYKSLNISNEKRLLLSASTAMYKQSKIVHLNNKSAE